MTNKLIAALLVAASVSIAAPAFASGYGPAPFYRPSVGAPASQQGQSAQTVAAERASASQNGVAQADATGFGPGVSGTTQAGQRAEVRASSYSPPVYVIGR
jgi:hypothetical protein